MLKQISIFKTPIDEYVMGIANRVIDKVWQEVKQAIDDDLAIPSGPLQNITPEDIRGFLSEQMGHSYEETVSELKHTSWDNIVKVIDYMYTIDDIVLSMPVVAKILDISVKELSNILHLIDEKAQEVYACQFDFDSDNVYVSYREGIVGDTSFRTLITVCGFKVVRFPFEYEPITSTPLNNLEFIFDVFENYDRRTYVQDTILKQSLMTDERMDLCNEHELAPLKILDYLEQLAPRYPNYFNCQRNTKGDRIFVFNDNFYELVTGPNMVRDKPPTAAKQEVCIVPEVETIEEAPAYVQDVVVDKDLQTIEYDDVQYIPLLQHNPTFAILEDLRKTPGKVFALVDFHDRYNVSRSQLVTVHKIMCWLTQNTDGTFLLPKNRNYDMVHFTFDESQVNISTDTLILRYACGNRTLRRTMSAKYKYDISYRQRHSVIKMLSNVYQYCIENSSSDKPILVNQNTLAASCGFEDFAFLKILIHFSQWFIPYSTGPGGRYKFILINRSFFVNNTITAINETVKNTLSKFTKTKKAETVLMNKIKNREPVITPSVEVEQHDSTIDLFALLKKYPGGALTNEHGILKLETEFSELDHDKACELIKEASSGKMSWDPVKRKYVVTVYGK